MLKVIGQLCASPRPPFFSLQAKRVKNEWSKLVYTSNNRKYLEFRNGFVYYVLYICIHYNESNLLDQRTTFWVLILVHKIL